MNKAKKKLIDPRDPESLKQFFEMTEGLTVYQQAAFANRSVRTIEKWKKKLGIQKNKRPFKDKKWKPRELKLKPPPKGHVTKEWLEEAYEHHGYPTIAKFLGCSSGSVQSRLKRYGIKRKPYEERVRSQNEFCDEEWLYYHYASRKQYLKWCKKNKQEPCEHGGQSLSVKKCAELAGVVQATIVNWLTKFSIPIRDHRESSIGKLNPQAGRKLSLEERREHRRRYFENYRNGKIVLMIGPYRFSNGKLLGTRKSFAAKNPKGPRI